MRILVGFIAALSLAAIARGASPSPGDPVTFPTQDGGIVYGLVYGEGERGVVLAHGGQFNKESWEKQAQALTGAGFRVLAFDFRGYGQSRGPHDSKSDEGRHFDVLAAAAYLRKSGAKSVYVVGASMGGDYAAEAAEAEPSAIDRIVLLASGGDTPLIKMKGPKLYIICRDDVEGDAKVPRLPEIHAQYEKASGKKEFIILEGSAHAQWIFATDQGERLTREILRFLSAP
ncbi:MAG TPA: alpha/beta fold hydrolase [Candidatus Acidoferrales bacterium]|nr:alpha/beta fold hydrolase [Candidatus Acidoferrales bacterium]